MISFPYFEKYKKSTILLLHKRTLSNYKICVKTLMSPGK